MGGARTPIKSGGTRRADSNKKTNCIGGRGGCASKTGQKEDFRWCSDWGEVKSNFRLGGGRSEKKKTVPPFLLSDEDDENMRTKQSIKLPEVISQGGVDLSPVGSAGETTHL